MDLFSGCGGLGYGFHCESNFNVKYAIDFDSNAANTYQLNFPETKAYALI